MTSISDRFRVDLKRPRGGVITARIGYNGNGGTHDRYFRFFFLSSLSCFFVASLNTVDVFR